MSRLIQYRVGNAAPVAVTSPSTAMDRLVSENWKQTPAHKRALRNVTLSIEGGCSPRAAMIAFAELVREQRRVVEPAPSLTVKQLDMQMQAIRPLIPQP